VLEHGENVLARNPWDVGAQMDMAEAADVLGLLDLAVWVLEQARQKQARDPTLNRALAQLYEKRGNFREAMALWALVRKARPADHEAEHKLKDLAVNETIVRGNYEEAMATGGPGRDDGAEDDEDEAEETPPPRDAGETAPAKDRVSREAAPIRARLQAEPTNPTHYLQIAALFRRAGQFEQARAVLQQGLGPTGNAFELTAELIDLDIEPFRRNLLVAEEKCKADPKDEAMRKLRIRLRKEINTRELEYFRQKADRFPSEMIHRFEVGVRLLRGGLIDEAIHELQLARNDQRCRWQAVLHLGHCFKARNNWKLAQRNFEEALQLLPPAGETTKRKEVLFLLAHGCAESGDLAHAVDLGNELANLDFGYRDIGRLLDDWQARLDKANVSP
jgi:tetratricopeptide (TPR) repeat protein